MDLLLWRHAEAEDGTPDSQRRLTPRGEKQAQRMAAWLKTHAPKDMRIVASPARRCQQTAQALGLPFETDPRQAPGSNVTDLLAAIHWPSSCGGKRNAILIVGHQPTLGQAAALLLSGSEADWPIKKGALWWLLLSTRAGRTQAELRLAISSERL
ncbi:SixA phosphatase family protein [Propionivibrio sp.]|uniref:SixA phosphatase family protein n=1 Tax=Propionivibrio sp. TaxID=2212460 RepID=UPI0039E4AB3E